MKVLPCPYLGLDDDSSVSRTVPAAAHRCHARRPPVAIDPETQTSLCLSGRYAECPHCPASGQANASVAGAAVQADPDPSVPVLNLARPKWAADPASPAERSGAGAFPPLPAAVPPQPAGMQTRGAAVVPAAVVPAAVASSVPVEAAWGAAHPPVLGDSGPAGPRPDESTGRRVSSLGWLWLLLPLAAAGGFVALVLALGNAWLWTPGPEQPASLAAVAPVQQPPTQTPVPTATLLATPTSPASVPATSMAAAPGAAIGRFATPTAVAGGKVVTLGPAAGVAGWWASGEQRGRLGDSFLYAGRYGGQEFLSATRFDLRSIPRGAALEQAVLRLTGLNGDRLAVAGDAQQGGGAQTTWLVQLVGEASAAELERSDYLMALSAPAAITLPPLQAEMLAAGKPNSFEFDDAGRAWLAQQLLDGATSLVVRIIASGGAGDTLFAWDSGQGPESAGNAPALVVSYGPPPPTPPPLPTKPFVVATLTPIPANALTVVAQAATATADAALVGTATPLPYQVYTPTPIPENLETVQAVAALNGLPAVLLLTPTPANAATATEQAAYATAVALTTGTFTPVPTGFVTPIIVAPSPPAQNVATAAARAVAATATAQAPAVTGLLPTPTPTSLPFNAVLGVYVYATPVFIPTNEATAVAYNRQLNDAILATGTPTPLPWNAIIITVVPTPAPPTPTPIPLFIPEADLSPTPTPTPTSTPPSDLPAEVRGKIVFKSNRGGAEAAYMLDPASGEVTLITQPWVFALAQGRLAYSPDGANRALVRQDDNARLQIFNESLQYGTVRKVTALGGDNYDPAWSPTGGWLAFVSTETGGDEIYRVNPEGTTVQRLTANTWEWDKHPSWSPDGSQIVFFSNREVGRRQLWIMDADGSNQRNLSSNEFEDWDPVWVR